MSTGPSLVETFCERFAALSPVVQAERDDVAVLTMDVSSLFRRLQKEVLVVLSSYESMAKALAQDSDWLDLYLLECVPALIEQPVLCVFGKPGSPRLVVPAVRTQATCADAAIVTPSELFVRKPLEAVRHAFMFHGSPRHFSPYRIDQVAIGSMFFGRTQLLKRLHNSRGGQLIVGPRRIGKSSLGKKLQASTGTIELRSWDGSTHRMKRCSYVDVSELGNDASSRLWGAVLKGFGLQPRDYAARGRITPYVSQRRSRETLVDDAAALSHLIGTYEGNLTIILDEVDKWIESEAKDRWPTLDRLRAMTDDGRARVMLIGYELLSLAGEHDRFPLAGRGRKIQVGPLERSEVEALVYEPMKELGIRFEGEHQVLNRIWEVSSGLPHIVQDICNLLVALVAPSKDRRVTQATLATAIDASATVKSRARGMLQSDLPLAEAIAGLLSLGGRRQRATAAARRTSWDAELDVAEAMTNGILCERLEKDTGYEYDKRDFALALAFLELRYIIRAADSSRTSWLWTSGIARSTMRQAIKNTGVRRWLQHVMAEHKRGRWREPYDSLLPE